MYFAIMWNLEKFHVTFEYHMVLRDIRRWL
jgi:hypothetical protein